MQFPSITSIFSRKPAPPAAARQPEYARLIVDQLPLMERLCRKAVANSGNSARGEADGGNEADLLLNEVLDHLKADDYRVLREFRGGSKLSTYLTTVISNLVVDHIRKRKGRSRLRERAAELGPLAEKLYELVHGRGYALQDAHAHLTLAHGISENEDELRELLDKVRGREELLPCPGMDWPYHGREVTVDGEIELVVPDPAKSVEGVMIDAQRDRQREQALSELLNGLSGEERYLLRLRFPATDEEAPRSMREIATLLGTSEKAADNRLRRILIRCRETLLKQGLSLDDLVSG